MRLNPVLSKPNTTETVHELVVTKAANTNTFGHQYIAVTTKKERVLLQTNLSQRLTVGDRLLVQAKLTPIQAPRQQMVFYLS